MGLKAVTIDLAIAAVRFFRKNADLTVSERTAAEMRTDLGVDTIPVLIQIAASDLVTDIEAGTGVAYLRAPFAFTLTAVRASALTAPTGAAIIINVKESGTTVLSTKITIDATEKTSTTATPAVISDSAIADDAELTIDFDQVGSTIAGKGVIVTLIGTRPV